MVLTVIATGYSLIFETYVFEDFAISFEILDILQVVFLGVVCTAVCWVARAWAMKSIDAVTVSLLVPLSAVIASVLSICLKIEEFTWNLLIGGVIILLSIAISAIFDYRKECQAKKHSIEEETKHEECQSQL